MGYRTVLKARIQAWRNRKDRYIIVYTVGDIPVKWLAWDNDQVWRWSKTKRMAAQFRTEQQAISEAESTSMAWQYRYSVHRL